MRIGEYTALLETTKDTIRHYEDLNLIRPTWLNNYKHYEQKDVLAYQVIVELKEYGFSLKDIQMIFELKHAYKCGDKKMVNKVYKRLVGHMDILRQEEEELHQRRIKLENELQEMKTILQTESGT